MIKKNLKNKINVFRFIKYRLKIKNSNCILLDTPEHGNLGDQAITISEKQYISSNFPQCNMIEITADKLNENEKKYAKLTPVNCLILVHGGGFLGELWPNEEMRFRRILKEFHNNRVIVFPQTITFSLDTSEGIAFFEESKKIYSLHPFLTICVRDINSYNFMKQYMPKVDVILTPDIVTVYNYMPSLTRIRKNIIICMRSDLEKCITDTEILHIKKSITELFPADEVIPTDTVIKINSALQSVKSTREKYVEQKLNEFASSKLIVTDRLHGMLFAAITGTPCIAYNNSNGKVKGVYEWIKHCDYVIFADRKKDIKTCVKEIQVNNIHQYDLQIMKNKFEPLNLVIGNALKEVTGIGGADGQVKDV